MINLNQSNFFERKFKWTKNNWDIMYFYMVTSRRCYIWKHQCSPYEAGQFIVLDSMYSPAHRDEMEMRKRKCACWFNRSSFYFIWQREKKLAAESVIRLMFCDQTLWKARVVFWHIYMDETENRSDMRINRQKLRSSTKYVIVESIL